MGRKPKKPKITVRSLKDLNLYSAFDVSKWSADHGINSVYLERRKERIMEVQWVYHQVPIIVVKDSRFPGKVLEKFPQSGAELISQTMARAQAYVESKYGVDMKWLPSLNAAFPAPAVDLLVAEIEDLISVWGLNTHEVPSVTISAERARTIKEIYPVPHTIRQRAKQRG